MWKGQTDLAIKTSPSLCIKTDMHLKDCWRCSKHQRVEAVVRTAQRESLHLHHSNKYACWSAGHSQTSGRLACPQLPQQINSNDQRTTYWALSFNSYSLNWPFHQSDTFMLLKYESTGSLSRRQRHLHCYVQYQTLFNRTKVPLHPVQSPFQPLFSVHSSWWWRERAAVQVDNRSQLPLC